MAAENLLEKWTRKLLTYKEGDQWALWANEENIVQVCRYDGDNIWATPMGHVSDEKLKLLGWKKVPTPANWPTT